MKLPSAICVCLISTNNGYSFIPKFSRRTSIITTRSTLKMGLFDGLKDAFSAPELSKSVLDKDRETPIDRWMGWSVVSGNSEMTEEKKASPTKEFVDSMDKKNYISASLSKPMGIVFEENDDDVNGIFVLSLSEGGAAEQDGAIKPGDQLIAVNDKKVAGLVFDEALGTIIDSEKESTQLIFFRGSAEECYGPTGASREWLDNFIKEMNAVPVEAEQEIKN